MVRFVDINAGDVPTVKTAFDSFTYQNAQHTDVTATLNAQQTRGHHGGGSQAHGGSRAAGNNNNGSATWTYSVADGALRLPRRRRDADADLSARKSTTITRRTISKTFQTFTITITGTNDAPVITTGPESVAYSGGKFTPGGNLPTVGQAPTTGTLSFTDVDLTDTHTVATQLTDASMSGPGAATLDMAALDALAPAPWRHSKTPSPQIGRERQHGDRQRNDQLDNWPTCRSTWRISSPTERR